MFIDPQNNPVAYAMTGSQSAGWAVEWRPTQIGTHVIDVKYGRTPVAGSPFICKVHDLSKVIILQREGATGLDVDGIPGEDVVFYGQFSFVVHILLQSVTDLARFDYK